MEQRISEITIRDLVNCYTHNGSLNNEEKVLAYNGSLVVRPEYQREFVYKTDKRDEVIRTILKNCCLNMFTWADNEDGTFECLDGQQRTISICDFIDSKYNVLYKDKRIQWDGLSETDQSKILDYKIIVNIVTGTEEEKLDWFKTINIAGETLTNQELRNAIYHGPWLSAMKKYFSKKNATIIKKYDGFISGKSERQEVLETAIKYLIINEGKKATDDEIESFMCKHRFDDISSADSMYAKIQTILDWARKFFDKDEKVLKTQSQNWGELYYIYSKNNYDITYTRNKVNELIKDDDVTNKKGIIEYILSNGKEEKCLNIRTFDDKDKMKKYNEQGCKCKWCNNEITFAEAAGDHIIPWSRGGKTEYENLQILCPRCNATKSNKY